LSAQSALAKLAELVKTRPSKLRIDFRNIRLFTVVAASSGADFLYIFRVEGDFCGRFRSAGKKACEVYLKRDSRAILLNT
jgi:hypothetical protein